MGYLLPGVASKYRGSEEEEWQVKGLCGFHELKPGIPKRSVPYAEDQPIGRFHIQTSMDELLGRLLGVSSDCPGV